MQLDALLNGLRACRACALSLTQAPGPLYAHALKRGGSSTAGRPLNTCNKPNLPFSAAPARVSAEGSGSSVHSCAIIRPLA